MKRKMWLLVSLFVVILWGCDINSVPDSPIIIVEDSVSEITVNASAYNGLEIVPSGTISIKEGGTVSIAVNEKDGYSIDSVFVNDQFVNFNDTVFKLTDIVSNTSILFKGVSDSILFLTEGSETRTNPWFLKSMEFFDINQNFLYSLDLKDDPRPFIEMFYKRNGTIESFRPDGSPYMSGHWTLVDGIFNTGGEWQVVLWSKNLIVYQREVIQSDGHIEFFRITEEKRSR